MIPCGTPIDACKSLLLDLERTLRKTFTVLELFSALHGSPFISEGIGKGGGAAETAMSLTQEMSNGWVGNLISTGVTMLGGVVKHGGGRNVGAPVVVGIS